MDLWSVFLYLTQPVLECLNTQAFVYITADFKTAQNAVNEVMLWSRIVQEKRNARINEAVRLEYPYALTDPSECPCRFPMLIRDRQINENL